MNFYPLIVLLHVSDPTANMDNEISQDYLGFGVRLEHRQLEIEATLGGKVTHLPGDFESDSGLAASIAIKLVFGKPEGEYDAKPRKKAKTFKRPMHERITTKKM